MLYFAPFLNGLGLGGGLIMAIGAQNAHVLKTGLKREHVALTVLVCIVVDIILIGIGVAGVGAAVQSSPLLLALARWGGAAFLFWYGLRSWRAAWVGGSMASTGTALSVSAGRAVVTALSLSLLNPHVYLDTVVLVGAIGGHFALAERPSFAFGAMCASVLWFTSLGFGARGLSRWFNRPAAWRGIDALTGTTMLGLSASVALGG
jgi:L-lysine exporter family protein LysE/ArgO